MVDSCPASPGVSVPDEGNGAWSWDKVQFVRIRLVQVSVSADALARPQGQLLSLDGKRTVLRWGRSRRARFIRAGDWASHRGQDPQDASSSVQTDSPGRPV